MELTLEQQCWPSPQRPARARVSPVPLSANPVARSRLGLTTRLYPPPSLWVRLQEPLSSQADRLESLRGPLGDVVRRVPLPYIPLYSKPNINNNNNTSGRAP